MTRDDIIRMAREAGMEWPVWGVSEGDLTRFATLAAERDTALLRRLLSDLALLKTAMQAGPPEYDWQDYMEMLGDAITALRERLKEST
jgi:hypothetical protein